MKKNEEELTGISVPEDLQERIRERLTAAALAEEEASLPASFRINRMILQAARKKNARKRARPIRPVATKTKM